jgi:uncharacterized protein (TIGR03435 family)
MKSYVLTALAVLAVWAPAFAQHPDTKLTFEAASVRLADPSVPGGPGTSDPGRIAYPRVAMIYLLTKAFGIQGDRILGGADWLTSSQYSYSVTATMRPSTTPEQFRVMLQNLLADRFHLRFHHETRTAPGYELIVAPGKAELQEVTPTEGPVGSPDPSPRAAGKDGFRVFPPGPQKQHQTFADRERWKYQEQTMEVLAADLGNMVRMSLGDPPSKRPEVIDKTGLHGKYSFYLEYSCAGCPGEMAAHYPDYSEGLGSGMASTPSGLPNIFTAVEKQLGLRLRKVNHVPVDVVILEHLDKTPREN